MASMSYCLFENTFSELQRCYEKLENIDDLSESEQEYALLMIELCQKIVELNLHDTN